MVGFLLTPSSNLSVMQGGATNARSVVFFDVNVGDTPVGRIKFELYSDIVPKFLCAR